MKPPNNRIIALWAVPRSVSTAFERMMMERGDFFVMHEPFSASYYMSEHRQSQRYLDQPLRPDQNYDRVLQEIIDHARKEPVFIKDMACHINPRADEELVARFENAFLIRDPRKALPSFFYKWPDFTNEEAGYQPIWRLFELARKASGKTPVVIDADDLLSDPEKTVRAFCESIGLNFMPGSLNWDPGKRPEWKMWEGWHDDAENSRGFEKKPGRAYPALSDDARLQKAYEFCLPYYQKLRQHRLSME